MDYENMPDSLTESTMMCDLQLAGHLEYVSDIANPSLSDVSRGVYDNIIDTSPGLKAAWDILGREGRTFNESYAAYVYGDEKFLKEEPGKYDFIKDRIFFGREYIKQSQGEIIHDSVESVAMDELFVPSAAELIHENQNLREDVWEHLTAGQRETVLRDFSDKVADIFGVTISRLEFVDMPDRYWGEYTPSDGSIKINSDVLSEPEKLKGTIDTLLHETRHAFQYEIVNGNITGNVAQETLAEWRYNIDNYIPASLDFQAYRNQSIEKDARNFAGSVLEKIIV